MESKNNVERKSTIFFYERLKLKRRQNSLKSRKLANYFELEIHKNVLCKLYIVPTSKI